MPPSVLQCIFETFKTASFPQFLKLAFVVGYSKFAYPLGMITLDIFVIIINNTLVFNCVWWFGVQFLDATFANATSLVNAALYYKNRFPLGHLVTEYTILCSVFGIGGLQVCHIIFKKTSENISQTTLYVAVLSSFESVGSQHMLFIVVKTMETCISLFVCIPGMVIGSCRAKARSRAAHILLYTEWKGRAVVAFVLEVSKFCEANTKFSDYYDIFKKRATFNLCSVIDLCMGDV